MQNNKQKMKTNKLNGKNNSHNANKRNNNLNFNHNRNNEVRKKSKEGGKQQPNKKVIQQIAEMQEGSWEWAGCDDNVFFGHKKSKDFLDARLRKRSDIKTLVRLHNNEAGRLVSLIK